MAKKKVPLQKKRKVECTLETAYPFSLKADRDYRLTFRNGQSAIYHGAALASNPQVLLAEIVQVHDYSTGELVFEVPREEKETEKPAFYVAQ